jgi:glycosyltransferase involved in cell wall biosynthesis
MSAPFEFPIASRNLGPIMLLIHGMRGGGSERQMSYLANELIQHHPTILVTLSPVVDGEYPVDPRVRRLALNRTSHRKGWMPGLLANRARIVAIRKAAVQTGASVVVSFCDTNNILACLACARASRVVACERSDPRKQRLTRSWEFLRDRAYPLAHTIVSQSEGVTNYFRHRYPSSPPLRWRTIPSAIRIPPLDLSTIQSDRGSVSRKRWLVLGRLSEEKRVDLALETWSNIASEFPDWVLSIAGDGSERSRLQQLARHLRIEDRLEWIGWAENAWAELSRSHAFSLTSLYEGFPQAMLEAMATGLPVVAMDCCDAVRQVITDGVQGFVATDRSEFQTKIRRVLSDATLRDRMGNLASARAHQYDWGAVRHQWLQLLVPPAIDPGAA